MNKHLDILLVEDSEDDAVLLLREIKKGGYDPNFVRVETADGMLACLNDQTWDIVISDYSLPGFNAPDALKVLQETGLDLPFIIVSGKVEDEAAVECMTAGAHDFIRKDNMVRLIPAIERELNEAIVRKKRKEAEDALQESEERFRTLYSAMNEGVAIHEMIYDEAGEPVDYRILNVNPVFESITGIKIEDVIGVRASELYGTGEAPYLNIYAKVATSGESATFETTFEPMDKTFKISVFSPDKGKFATLFADITERKRSEKEIVKLSRFNKSIITSIPVGIVTMDQAGKVTSANDVFLEIMGSPSLEETLKLGVPTHSVEAVGMAKAVKNTLMTGSSFEMNGIHYTSHWGKEVIINLRGVPLKDMDRNIIGVVLVIDDITDMAKAEHALHESEERYETLFNGSPDAILLADPESGKIIDANKAASKLLQKPIDEIIGLNQTQLHPPKIYDYSRSTFEEHAGKSEKSRFETIMLRSDGSEVPVEVSAEPIIIKGKTILQGIFRDITERKRADDMLRLHSEMIENMGEGVYLIRTSDGIIVYANPRFEEMFGYEHGEMIGQHVSIVNAPTDISPEEKVRVLMKILLEEGKWHGDIQNIKKDGTPFWSHVNVSVFEHSEYGQVLVSVHEDITERKRAEEALIESEEKFRNFFELSVDLVCIADVDGYFRQINDSWQRVMGYSKEDLLSKPFMDYIHPDDKAMTMNIISEKLKRGETALSFENRYICKDGSIVWLEWISQPQVGTDLTFAIARDITERKQAEEKLKETAEELARSNEELKSLDTMKNDFLSNVSHELKTPLISIQGFSEVVQDEMYGPLNDQQKKAMDTVVRNCERLGRLIDSVLYLTIKKAGRDTYTFAPVNMSTIISNAIIDTSPQANSQELIIEQDIAPDLSLINGDTDKLTQVLINLIENATKFTHSGGKITVKAHNEDENVHITVNDTGIGIPNDLISNLFDKFYQVDASTTRRYGGTGIGLYISKLIVEVHKGKIWAESEEGVGTTFHVVLPK